MQASIHLGRQQPPAYASLSPDDSNSPTASQQYYLAAAQPVAAVSKRSVTQKNQHKGDQIMAALEQFFQTRLTGLGLSLQNCSPLDVLIYCPRPSSPVEAAWRQPYKEDGSRQMAPASGANCISALSKGFQATGRGSIWLEGDPAKSPDVKAWLIGHIRDSTAAGFKTTVVKVGQQ